MKERPILFSALMVRAILEGRKTQTRRIAKEAAHGKSRACPYGAPGDRLWVRETWALNPIREFGRMKPTGPDDCVYRADGTANAAPSLAWTPSIHMPRVASRINLEVTGVRVERLTDISEDDAVAEGIEWKPGLDPIGPCKWRLYGKENTGVNLPVASYESLWGSINGAESWDLNPWVWVVEFKRVTP